MTKKKKDWFDTHVKVMTLDNNPEQEVIEENNKTSTKNKDMKKLYRKIAEKTHPDKIDDKEMLEVFRTAASAYNNGDIATILEIAGNLNIELLELSKESIELLENNVKNITKEIDTMKNEIENLKSMLNDLASKITS